MDQRRRSQTDNYWIRVLPDKDVEPVTEVLAAVAGTRGARAHLMFRLKVDGDGKFQVSFTIAALPTPTPEPKGTM